MKVASRSNRDIGLETDERKKGRRVDKNESSRCSTKPSAHFLETLSPQGGTETETRSIYRLVSRRRVELSKGVRGSVRSKSAWVRVATEASEGRKNSKKSGKK